MNQANTPPSHPFFLHFIAPGVDLRIDALQIENLAPFVNIVGNTVLGLRTAAPLPPVEETGPLERQESESRPEPEPIAAPPTPAPVLGRAELAAKFLEYSQRVGLAQARNLLSDFGATKFRDVSDDRLADLSGKLLAALAALAA